MELTQEQNFKYENLLKQLSSEFKKLCQIIIISEIDLEIARKELSKLIDYNKRAKRKNEYQRKN